MNWLTGILNWFKSLFSGGVSSQTVVKIQACTVKACNFLPTAESVVALVSAGNPAVVTIEAIANSICAVVSKTPPTTTMVLMDMNGASKPTPIPPMWIVNGVSVQGTFVK